MSSSKYMVMGGRTEELVEAFGYAADVICLDLEDTVAPDRRESTRDAVQDFISLGQRLGRKTAVRISPLSSFDGLHDLLLMQQLAPAPDMIVLAKADSPQEVALVRNLLLPVLGNFHLQPIIETSVALSQVEDIAAVPGVGSISLGGKDLSESLNVMREWEPLLYARSRCSAAAAMRGIPIVDGPQSRDESPEELRSMCGRLKAMGFAGKSAVFREHLAIINEVWGR